MSDNCDPLPKASELCWPDADRVDWQWVTDAGKNAPGLDSLLSWAFRAGASGIDFQTRYPVWVRIDGRNYRVTKAPVNELEISHIGKHFFGVEGMALLQGATDLDTTYVIQIDRSTQLRFELIATPTVAGLDIFIKPISGTDKARPEGAGGGRQPAAGCPQ